MDLDAYILSCEQSSPAYVLANTEDISRLLYSHLHSE